MLAFNDGNEYKNKNTVCSDNKLKDESNGIEENENEVDNTEIQQLTEL